MKKLLLIGLLCTVNTAMIQADNTTKLQHKINFGQKIFRKKLQRKCGYTASYWAQQHTLLEWKMIEQSGDFQNEFASMCPRGAKVLKEKWIEPLYFFAKEYAKDTGKRPRC